MGWQRREGREKSQQTNKSLSVSGVMGWTEGGREAGPLLIRRARWIVSGTQVYFRSNRTASYSESPTKDVQHGLLNKKWLNK